MYDMTATSYASRNTNEQTFFDGPAVFGCCNGRYGVEREEPLPGMMSTTKMVLPALFGSIPSGLAVALVVKLLPKTLAGLVRNHILGIHAYLCNSGG